MTEKGGILDHGILFDGPCNILWVTCREELGQKEDALADYLRILEVEPNNKIALAKLEDLPAVEQ